MADTGTTGGTGTGEVTCPAGAVPAGLERTLTQVARAILRLDVPAHALAAGQAVDRAGYWLLVRVSEQAPVRLSELAGSVDLDLSTVSRQVRDLVASGLVAKEPDPHDGRASLLRLTGRGAAVLDAVSDARRQALADAVAGWSPEERDALATSITRLAAGLQTSREGTR